MPYLVIAAVAISFLSAAYAQNPEQSWANLQTLAPGQTIEVVDQKLATYRGGFVAVSEDAITFEVNRNELTLQQADVLRVTLRERSKTLRNSLIGLAAGAGAGLAAGAGLLAATGGSDFPGSILGPAVAMGAAGGFALGAAVPSYPTVYRAERRPQDSRPAATSSAGREEPR